MQEGTNPEVRVTEDGMEAYICKAEGAAPGELRLLLADAGVTHGIIGEALEKAGGSEEVLVARGTPPTEGEDGRAEFSFETNRSAAPRLLENGRVDFHDLGIVCNVRAGDLLARLIPPVPGRPGMTVRGEPVDPRPVKAFSLRAGKGVRAEQDRFLAEIDGQPVLEGSLLSVRPVFGVSGDVGPATGDVDFVGSVKIAGSVMKKYRVKAGGDVDISGLIDGGTVEAEGNVLVKGGLQGGGTGSVKAGGDVTVRFIENASVSCRGTVIAGESIMHSRVVSGQKVKVDSGKGAIVGGVVQARDLVKARVAGSPLGTTTVIEVGFDPELRAEYLSICESLEESEKNLVKTDQAIELLKKLQKAGSLSEDKAELLGRLTRTRFVQTREQKGLAERKKEIEEEVEKVRKGRVEITEKVYPGVRIAIGKAILSVTDEQVGCVFYLADDGDIRSRPAG